ncbi:LADA_0B08372g1_1 [Lachancea dasiensis]|uniref:LADA_0B08372g1_1 n=1 Tax=Lachancea dasiensis TaxID=1072105 RepID=A0A1G4IUY1_9SACH|nr:LADA_0B08372g1_1 [Lachancea dasiensis]
MFLSRPSGFIQSFQTSLRQLTFPQCRQVSILSQLQPSEGSTKTYKRVGRGPSSGKGKTSARGQKGQKARGKVKSWFEGGQTPIYKLFPKIGFTNVTSLELNELNLDRIMWFHRKGRLDLEAGEVLDMKKMKDLGLVTGSIKDGVKLLGDGKEYFNLPLKIEATRASKSAIQAIEKAGGEFTARYFNKLGLRAHLSPQWFMQNRGRIPLQARPVKRKDIDYYSNPGKRGYLVKENHPLLQQIQEAKSGGHANLVRKSAKKTALELQLAAMADSPSVAASAPSRIVTMDQLKK